MQLIKDEHFGGERPLFASHDLKLEGVVFEPGESALKCCRNLELSKCSFQGKYPLWHVDNFVVEGCVFEPGARAAIWYSDKLTMRDTRVDAPKMFREVDGITLENVVISDAQETLWHVRNVKITDMEVSNADYLFMHSSNIKIKRWRQKGNYAFQYCRNVEIHNAYIEAKDSFWETENVTIYDSEIHGEYLGWHSKKLKLVNCHISGTQPLCYCTDLVLENCTFAPDCDLAFEDSIVRATINSAITSVKNPRSGYIRARGFGEIIIDKNIRQPADCKIEKILK